MNSITRDLTVAVWVYRTGDGPGFGDALISRQIGTGAAEPYILAYLPGGSGMHFLVNTQGLGYSQEGTAPFVPLNEWHHWVGTYDGAQVKFYKDGVLQWSVNHAGGNLAVELNNPLAIGGGFNTGTSAVNEPFVGKMDDVQLYNRALSATEVQTLYSGVAPPPDTSAPSIPQGLGATAISSTQINLAWNSSTDNVGVAGYRIYRGGTAIGTTTSTTYSDTGLTASTSYTYTVTAYDAANNESNQSAPASATTSAPPPPPSSDDIIHFSLDENTGTTAVDQSGNGNHGTLTNGASWTTGITGSGVAFGGANDYVRVPSSASINTATTGITVAAWVYRTANQSNWATVATRQTGTTAQEHFFLGFDNAGNYRWFVSTTAGYSSTSLGGPAPLQQWIHVVGTYDGTTVRFYVNGVENFSTPRTGTIVTDTTPVILGGSFNDATTTVGEPFAGRIDEFHLYNRALSAAEVQSLYSGSLPPPDTSAPSIPQGLAATAISSTQINLAWVASTDNVAVTGYRVYRGGSAVGTTTGTSYSDTGLTANTPYTYTVTAFDAGNNESAQSAQASATTLAAQSPPPTAGQVLYLPLNQSAGTIAVDVSAGANAGTLLGSTAWTSGKNAGGVQFDGFTGRISVPSSSSINAISSGITVAAWVYRNVDDPGTATVITRQKGTTPQEYFYLGFINGGYRWFVNTLQSGYSNTGLGGAAPVGQWVHMAGTYDGSSVKLYVNGVLQFSTPLTGLLASDTTPILIGASYNGASQTAPAELLNGKVDDVQVFDHALTASEIVSMFQQTAPSGPPPSVSITSPTSGSVAGTITLAATATDDTGIAGVQFAIDGVTIGPEQPNTPFQLQVNTAWYANGNHTLTAIARDSSGNTTVSAPVVLTFSNATPKPLGKIMPLGDSLTAGFVATNDPQTYIGGYRKYLWEKLLANAIGSMNFVGTQVSGVASMGRATKDMAAIDALI